MRIRSNARHRVQTGEGTAVHPASGASKVVSLIRSRCADHRRPEPGRAMHADGFKLGLAVEGGGMRGIISGGMLLALHELGLLGAFDAFYGTSSGSLNLAYVMGGSTWEALPVYYDHLTSGFVRRDRWNPATPVVDMEYAFDEVMNRTVPIGWAQIRLADRPVKAVLTNVDRAEFELKDLRELGDDGITYLKAGAWMPFVAGPTPVIAGTRYVDGGLLCPDPVYAATADGCTHVLLLNTSPQGRWPAAPRARPFVKALLNRWQEGLGQKYVDCRIQWDRDRAAARYDQDVFIDGASVLRVATPQHSHQVQPLTMRRDLLLDGVRAGYQTVVRLFGDGKRPYLSITLR